PAKSPSTSPSSPSQPASPSYQQPAPSRPGWGGGFGGMLGGLLLGGLLGGLLFGHGMGGGIGLLEIAIIARLVLLALSYMRRQQPAGPSGYATPGGYGPGGYQSTPSGRYEPAGGGTATLERPTPEAPAGPSDLERGLGHIRQMDGGFDPRAFAETASDI